MGEHFSLDWGNPQPQAGRVEPSQPLDGETLARLEAYAETVLKTLQKTVPGARYDEASIRRLSQDLSANGSSYKGDARVKIANMYGAFLGKAIRTTHSKYPATWVRWKDDIALEFNSGAGGAKKLLFPITRLFKHLDNGEQDSIYSLFMAVPQFLAGEARRKPNPAKPEPATEITFGRLAGAFAGMLLCFWFTWLGVSHFRLTPIDKGWFMALFGTLLFGVVGFICARVVVRGWIFWSGRR
jgi:hypothetical protein